MTTPSHPSFWREFADWLHNRDADLEARVAKVEAAFGERLTRLEQHVAALLAKDAPMVERDVKATEAVVTQDVHDAEAVAADVEQAAGA